MTAYLSLLPMERLAPLPLTASSSLKFCRNDQWKILAAAANSVFADQQYMRETRPTSQAVPKMYAKVATKVADATTTVTVWHETEKRKKLKFLLRLRLPQLQHVRALAKHLPHLNLDLDDNLHVSICYLASIKWELQRG